MVEDEAAISCIIINNMYVTISDSQISLWHIVPKLKTGIKDSEHFSIAVLIGY
jgi:hypothetical protein